MSSGEQGLLPLLYSAYQAGPDSLQQTLVQFRDQLTPELGRGLLDDYAAAVERQDAGNAIAAATIASRAFNFMGRPEDAFNALMDVFEIHYMLAQTESAYANIETAIQQLLAGDPYGQGSPLTGLRARMLAADCSFFASEASADDQDKKTWLQTSLRWLADAIPFLVPDTTAALFSGYASTAVAVYRRLVSKQWSGEPWAAAGLAKITQALDRVAPGKLAYSDPSKTANISAARAEMSALFNDGAYAGEPAPPSAVSGLFGPKGS